MAFTVRVRLAKTSDLDFVVRGIREIFTIEKKPATKRMLAERRRKARAAIRKREVLVAESADGNPKPIGFLCFETSSKTPFGVDYGLWNERFAWVSWSFVAAPHRGKGAGRTLYAAFERECKRRKIESAMLDVFEVNAKSRSFHEKLGFKPLLTIFSKKTR